MLSRRHALAVFAAVALTIAVVGVAGVLAFSVSGRTREFGIRLAIGAQPRQLLTRVILEGAVMAIESRTGRRDSTQAPAEQPAMVAVGRS